MTEINEPGYNDDEEDKETEELKKKLLEQQEQGNDEDQDQHQDQDDNDNEDGYYFPDNPDPNADNNSNNNNGTTNNNNNNNDGDGTGIIGDDILTKKQRLIKEIVDEIESRHKFVTIEENDTILVYRNGVYVPSLKLIEKEVHRAAGYQALKVATAEVEGMIKKKSYRSITEFNTDPNLINLRNGIYHVREDMLTEHTSDILFTTQKPITYVKDAKPKLIGKFLSDVLWPNHIRSAWEIAAYTFWAKNEFEEFNILFGYGGNGKGVYIQWLTALHGVEYVSVVPLMALQGKGGDGFSISDLEGKYCNFDAETPDTTIHDTDMIKRLTGQFPVRIERKRERAYNAYLFAKQFFLPNRMPETDDLSDAYFRRYRQISFPHKFVPKPEFEEMKKEAEVEGIDLTSNVRVADKDLHLKLTTEEEKSGAFNVLMHFLRIALKNGTTYQYRTTTASRRKQHKVSVDPYSYFMEEIIEREKDAVNIHDGAIIPIPVEATDNDMVRKSDLYACYVEFARQNNIPTESMDKFNDRMKYDYGVKDGGKEPAPSKLDRKRKAVWKHLRLAPKYLELINSSYITAAKEATTKAKMQDLLTF